MIIDTHFHAFPVKVSQAVAGGEERRSRGTGLHAFDHREYLNVMDKSGIDIGVLVQHRRQDRKARQPASAPRSYVRSPTTISPNAHAKHPQRFRSFARLPMLDVDDCVRELERCYKDLQNGWRDHADQYRRQIYR